MVVECVGGCWEGGCVVESGVSDAWTWLTPPHTPLPTPHPPHQLDVIVDGLGHAHDVADDALLLALLCNRVRGCARGGRGGWGGRMVCACAGPPHAARRCTHTHKPPTSVAAVAADDKQHVDAPKPQPIHNLSHLGIAARRALRWCVRAWGHVGAQGHEQRPRLGPLFPPRTRPSPSPLAAGLAPSRPPPRLPHPPLLPPPLTSTVPPLSWMPSTLTRDSCTGLACRSRKPRSP